MIAKGHRERSWQVRLVKFFERLTYRVCDISIETNESYRSIALSRGGMHPEDVFVVRSAPESSRFMNAKPNESWRNGRKHLVGYVGVMGLQDGIDYLVDAAHMIITDWGRDDIQFALVGSGPELPRLRKRIDSLGIAEQVNFTGRLSEEDLAAVLSTADVGANPDEANEMNDISTMNKIMEYMAFSKPMVQFDLREGRVSAGNASLYADRNDTSSFAKCILQLIDDPWARTEMGRVGLQRLQDELSWDLQIPKLLAAYERALRKRARDFV